LRFHNKSKLNAPIEEVAWMTDQAYCSIKKSSPSPMFNPATPWTAGWMLATTCPDGSFKIGFGNVGAITAALGRTLISANVITPISK